MRGFGSLNIQAARAECFSFMVNLKYFPGPIRGFPLVDVLGVISPHFPRKCGHGSALNPKTTPASQNDLSGTRPVQSPARPDSMLQSILFIQSLSIIGWYDLGIGSAVSPPRRCIAREVHSKSFISDVAVQGHSSVSPDNSAVAMSIKAFTLPSHISLAKCSNLS